MIAVQLAALAAVYDADFGSLIETLLPQGQATTRLTTASVDEVVAQSLGQYDYARYRNVIDDSIFAVNIVIKEEPVKIVKAEPPPPPPPPPPEPEKPAAPKLRPFTARLEVTGILITPERKLVMIWDKVKKESQILRESEKIRRWNVVLIDKERVIMKHDWGRRYEFIINEDTLSNF